MEGRKGEKRGGKGRTEKGRGKEKDPNDLLKLCDKRAHVFALHSAYCV